MSMATYSTTSCDYSDTGTATNSNAHVWRVWNHEYNTSTATTASSTTSNEVVWNTWCDATTSTATVNYNEKVWVSWIEVQEETKEQRAEREKLQREQEARDREERLERERRIAATNKKRQKAEVTAKELLKDLIGDEELKVYEDTGRLYVRGRKYDYIIPRDGTIQQIQKNKIVDLCVHLRDKSKFPPTDNVIALKLHLEANEDEILKMANNHGEKTRMVNVPLPRAACQ